jgi:hypothetical protein
LNRDWSLHDKHPPQDASALARLAFEQAVVSVSPSYADLVLLKNH